MADSINYTSKRVTALISSGAYVELLPVDKNRGTVVVLPVDAIHLVFGGALPTTDALAVVLDADAILVLERGPIGPVWVRSVVAETIVGVIVG